MKVYHNTKVFAMGIRRKEMRKMYQKLYALLEKTGETPYKVSKATGISQTAFSNWKAGIARPGTKNLATLAKYFNVSMEYFMEDEKGETKLN